jgi:NAD(P)-dependent dehydrogenase (short-subunit alcohol dehydrogenase family)
MQSTALVTGGNRGIGLEVCRQMASRGLRVILTARDRGQGQAAADELKSLGLDVRFVELDLSSDASVARCATHLASKEIEVDVLVNNAGVYLPGTALTAPLKAFDEGWQVHVLGTLRMTRAFVPAMIRRCYGRVVNLFRLRILAECRSRRGFCCLAGDPPLEWPTWRILPQAPPDSMVRMRIRPMRLRHRRPCGLPVRAIGS